jgi:predicted phosphoribosyltransferase
MESINDILIQNREEAGRLLSKKLQSYVSHNTVVVGIPSGGVCVAAAVAHDLSLPLEVCPCLAIKHPSRSNETVGSVSIDEVYLHNQAHDIPQSYFHHQLTMLRGLIQMDYQYYYGKSTPASFQYKTVILVDDVIESVDSIMACLRSIQKQRPVKIIIAIPFVRAEIARLLRTEADDIVFLQMKNSGFSGMDFFDNFPEVDRERVRLLMNQSRQVLEMI